MSTSAIEDSARTRLHNDPTVKFRRVAGAIALPIGILLQAASNAVYSLITMNGGSDATGAGALELVSSYPTQSHLAVTLSVIGSMLIVAGVPAALRVLRPARPRLSLVGGILMMAGYIAYFGIVFSTTLHIALAATDVDAAAAIDASQDNVWSFPFMILFIVGNILGTFLLGLAVLLSKQLPTVAGVLIMAWPVLHIIGLIAGTEWFAVAGATLETIGLVILAMAALRTSDAEWAHRG
jgi:hypothetical protein